MQPNAAADNKQLALAFDMTPLGSLEAYIHWAQRFPMLTAEQEQDLAERLQRQDVEAAKQLVMSHLRLVIRIARGYTGYGLALGDLVQEGNIGLLKAVKRFDPKVGVRLVSFAIHWIKAEIHEFVIRNWRIVKIATTKAQRKLFFNLRKHTQQRMLSHSETQAVAEDLGVSTTDVNQMAVRLLAGHDQAYDSTEAPSSLDDTQSANPLADSRYNPHTLLENAEHNHFNQRALKNALHKLDARARAIIEARWLVEKKATLHQLAELHGVSAERIRQLEQLALKQLKGWMNVNGDEVIQ